MTDIEPKQLQDRLQKKEDFVLLDVREQNEFDAANIGGQLIPLRELPQRVNELDKQKEIVVLCHHGGRSRKAASFLEEQGFSRVINLSGGIDRWSVEIDSKVPRY